MNAINRQMINICSDQLEKSQDFYTKLFDFKVEFESEWYIQLRTPKLPFEIGIIQRTHDLVPATYQHLPQGFYLTFVVDDADKVYEIALSEKYDIVEPPVDTFYGQRRFLLKDPNGALIDVSSLIPDFQ